MFKAALKGKKSIMSICVFALFLALAFVMTLLSAKAADAVITAGDLSDGRSFAGGENLQISKDLAQAPKTYEAVVYVPQTVTEEGTIFGNYINLSTPHINFAIDSAGRPKMYIHDNFVKDEKQTKISFGSSIRGEKWVHVVITHEPKETGDVFKCYVNGALVSTQTSEYHYELDMVSMQSLASFYLGQDFRTPYEDRATYHFKGKIKNLALYSDVLTADEISRSYASGVDLSDDALMLYYDLSDAEGLSNIPDLSGNGYNVEPLYHNRGEEISKTDYPYSFAVLGDTQFLLDCDVKSRLDDNAENDTDYFADIYNWIIENKDKKNIQRVLGVGDITESNTAAEWEYAVSQFAKLEGADIPYSITWGYSHDGLTGEEFTSYFKGSPNFTESDITYYSGVDSATSLANYCQRFSVGETKYMIMSLGWAPKLTSDVLSWADRQIKDSSDHKVIIITHYYLGLNGEYSEETEAIWNDIITDNPNVAMVLSGHIHYSANIVRSFKTGRAGHTVAQFLINPQYMDKYYGYDQTGMVAMFYFSEDGRDFKVEYVSTTKTMQAKENNSNAEDVLYGSKNEFAFAFPAKLQTEYGEIKEGFESVKDYPFVVFDNNGNWIGASDCLIGENSATSAVHIAKNHISANVWDGESYGSSEVSAIILMRDDVAMGSGEYYNNFSQIQGTVKIDLNGYTLSAPSSKALFNVMLKQWTGSGDKAVFHSEITVVNGKINIYGRELVRFYSDNKTTTEGKTFAVNFENVDVFVKGSTTSLVLRSDVTTTVADQNTYIKFTDCNIDLTGATKTVTVCDFANQEIDSEITFTRGSIISDKANYVIAQNTTSYGSLTFGGDGEYTVLKLPEGVAATSEKFNDGVLSYEASGVENGIVTYALMGSIEGYGKFPAKYHSAQKYPFIIFDNNGSFVNAAAYFYGSKAADSAVNIAKNYISTNVWNGASYGDNAVSAYIVLRRDVNMASDENYNNISQVRGALTIDLNGYTLAAQNSASAYMFPSDIKGWGSGDNSVFPTEVNVINGNIDLFHKPLIRFSANATAISGGYAKEFDYKFSNVKFFVKGATSEFAMYHAGGAVELYPTVTFTDCTVDLTGATANEIVLFNLGNSNTNTNVKINGGSIILGEKKAVVYSKESGNGTISFGKGSDSLYTAITVPDGVELPIKTANDGKLSLVKVDREATATTYRFAPASLTDYTPKMSITLGNDLVMNVYVPVKSTQKITFNGISYDNPDDLSSRIVDIEGEAFYCFKAALASSLAAKDVELVATVSDGESVGKVTFTFSTVKYAEKILNDNSITDTEKTLVRDVLAYIRAAYAYFGTNDAEKIAKINTLIGETYSNKPVAEGSATAETIGMKSVTFVLDGTPAMRFYLADGADASKYAFFIGGTRVKTETSADGKYIDIDVYAYALCETVTYTIDGAESGSFHINAYYTYVSGDSYTGADKAELVTLTECFWRYLQSAREYRDSVVNG